LQEVGYLSGRAGDGSRIKRVPQQLEVPADQAGRQWNLFSSLTINPDISK